MLILYFESGHLAKFQSQSPVLSSSKATLKTKLPQLFYVMVLYHETLYFKTKNSSYFLCLMHFIFGNMFLCNKKACIEIQMAETKLGKPSLYAHLGILARFQSQSPLLLSSKAIT